MNILRILFELFLIYLLYKLVFDFIIPVYRTTKRVKRQFGEMQQKMEEQQRQQQGFRKPEPEQPARKANEDYIDYEEVK